MKKRWIFFLISTTALLFVIGIWLGTNIDLKELNSKNSIKEGINRSIAVVNQDLGVSEGNSNVNYSDAFISSLNDGYKVVSYKEAQQGMENGDYSAIVTFPSDMSSNVYSLNSDLLKQAEIDFIVNPSLTENAYLDTYLKVMDLQKDISKTISFLYISSVFDEFHDAQDEVKNIFQNDEDDMTALNAVELHDFRLRVDWSDIPQVEFNPTEINFDEFVATVQGYADSMSKEYTDSYAVAKADYDVFQTAFSDSAERISSEGISWYNQVDQRETKVSEYATSLEQYRESFLGWSSNALLWYDANVSWHNNLSGYRDSLFKWAGNVLDWKGASDAWGIAYQDDMLNYKDSIDEYRNAVDQYSDDVFNHYSETTTTWAQDYVDYANGTQSFFNNLSLLVNEYNSKLQIDTDYVNSVTLYRTSLTDYQNSLNNAKDSLTHDYYGSLSDYHTQLNKMYFGEEDKNGLTHNINTLYENLLLYNQKLDQYKDALAADAGHSIDEDIENVSIGLEELITDIDEQKNDVDAYISEHQSSVDNAKTEVDAKFDDLKNTPIEPPPAAPDYSLLSNEGSFLAVDTSLLQSYQEPNLSSWSDVYGEDKPQSEDYVKLDTSHSDEKAVEQIEDFDEVLPQFEGQELEDFNSTEPEKLTDQLPEVPQILLDNCNLIVSESKKYVPTDYLNDDTKSKVNEIVGKYADNLTGVDTRLKGNMTSNNGLLTQAYQEYNSYVSTLHSDADIAYNAEVDDLETTLGAFYAVKRGTSEENQELLLDFSEKLPESRINSVTNKDYVNFAIAPLNFSTGDVRASDQTQVSEQQKRLNVLNIIIVALLIVVIISLLIVVYLYIRERKKKMVIN